MVLANNAKSHADTLRVRRALYISGNIMSYFKGIFCFYCGLFVWGVISAFYYRLPVPLVGYIGPFGEYPSSFTSSLESAAMVLAFYSIMGGFIPCVGLSALCVYWLKKLNWLTNTRLFFVSFTTSILPVLLLANLDRFIGPW